MKVISINNMKGGVGKTFIVFNFATYINFIHKKNKKRILVIDLDPQANTTENFLSPEQIDYTADLNISMIFEEKLSIKEWKNLIMNSKFENIDIVPSLLTLSRKESSARDIMESTHRLKRFIEAYGDNYDYIIIDNPPSTNIFTANALIASQYVFIPILPDRLSLVGLDLMIEHIIIAKDFNNSLEVGGLILNMFDKRYKTHDTILKVLNKKYSDHILSPILGRKADYQTSIDLKQPLYKITKTSSKSHIQMLELVKSMLLKIDSKD